MNLSTFVMTLILLAAGTNVNAFRSGSESNQELMKRSVEDALFTTTTTIKPPLPIETSKDDAPPLRNEILGTSHPCLYEYWSRPDIHTFGNMGFGGALHAAMAPFATKVSLLLKRVYNFASFTLEFNIHVMPSLFFFCDQCR